jgi:starch phosphorylase
LWPERFTNMTNGVTPRRWLAQANPGLAGLLDQTLGKRWRLIWTSCKQLKDSSRPGVPGKSSWRSSAPTRCVWQLHCRTTGITVSPDSLFDVQVKRIHEYKRQLLNVLHVVTRYQAILANPHATGCHAPSSLRARRHRVMSAAKSIIRLIHDVGNVINNDPRIGDKLKVVFIPNYGVSVAEVIMPGADLSEQISTAGTEASGTGNMKLALNGALTIGTDDGANIEIRQAVGDDNIFIFGLKTPEVRALRQRLPADALLRKHAGTQGGARCHWRMAGSRPTSRAATAPGGLTAVGWRPLHAAGRLCLVCCDPIAVDALYRSQRSGANTP